MPPKPRQRHSQTGSKLIKSKIPELGEGDGPRTQVAQMGGAAAVGGGILGEGAASGGAAAAPFLETVPPVAAGTAVVGGAAAVGIGAAGLAAAAHNAHMTILQGPNVSAPGAPTIEQIERAYRKLQAAALAAARVKPVPWVRVSAGACAALACPVAPLPGYIYKGGTYLCTKGGGNEGHHTPAALVSYLPYSAGPAVQMSPTDHAATASYGSSALSATYRAAQATAISSGYFMSAVGMDVADLSRSKFHHKYDGATAQMLAYANCLKQNGFVR